MDPQKRIYGPAMSTKVSHTYPWGACLLSQPKTSARALHPCSSLQGNRYVKKPRLQV